MDLEHRPEEARARVAEEEGERRGNLFVMRHEMEEGEEVRVVVLVAQELRESSKARHLGRVR